MPRGALTVVGTGIRVGLQLTPESHSAMETAETVLYLNAEPFADQWILSLRPDAENLARFYRAGAERRDI